MLAHHGSIENPTNDAREPVGATRVAAVGLWGTTAFEVACRTCALTHGHASAYLAAGVFATAIAGVTAGRTVSEAIILVRERLRPRLNDAVVSAVENASAAAKSGIASPETVESLGDGRSADQALAIALYCAAIAESFAHGVLLAVNHSGDSASTATLVGSLLGARFGMTAIPTAWVERLELSLEIVELASDLALARDGNPPDTTRYPPR